MTIETLEKYQGIVKNIKGIQLMIESLYTPVTSPNGREYLGSFSGSPSDPTASAVNGIFELQKDLYVELTKQVNLLGEICEWMRITEDEDPDLVAIVRMHYVAGLSWKETNRRMYGYDSYQTARKRVFRYFGVEK